MPNDFARPFSERYSHQLRLPGFGAAAQQKLRNANVLVVGAGGLGVPVLQYLAGMGVGRIGIVDDDVISLSNLHRQVLYTTEEVGRSKVLVAAAKLAAMNPEISVEPHDVRLSVDNALRIVSRYDIVVDATDNFSARYLINDACVILGKPFVYGAVHQYEGHVSVFNREEGPTYRCLYPSPPSATEIPDCKNAGVLGIVPGIIGCRQALEAVKLITGIGKSLSGFMQVYDFLNDEQYRIKLKADPANRAIRSLRDSYETVLCRTPAGMLQPHELNHWYADGRAFVLIDVRDTDEFQAGHLQQAVNIPLQALPSSAPVLAAGKPVVLYCQKGSRSSSAVAVLHRHDPTLELYELAGGMSGWLNEYGA